MRQTLRPRAVFAQGIQTHDPRLRSSIHGAFVAHDEKLFFRMERFDSRKTRARLRRLKRDEFQFEVGRLAGGPFPGSPPQRAFAIEQNGEPFHPAATGTWVCGGSGGGKRCRRARFRIFENTSRLKKCIPPRTRSTTPTFLLSVSNTPCRSTGI